MWGVKSIFALCLGGRMPVSLLDLEEEPMSSVAALSRIQFVDTEIAIEREECQPYSIVFRGS